MLANIGELEPEALWAACVKVWRMYCLFVSPALGAALRPVNPGLGLSKTAAKKLNSYKGGKRLPYEKGQFRCLCGCGIKGFGFAKSQYGHHQAHFRKRIARVILAYDEPGAVDPHELSLALKWCPELLSEDERQLTKALYQRDKYLLKLPASPPLPVPVKNPLTAKRGNAGRDRNPLRSGARSEGNNPDNEVARLWRGNRRRPRKG